MKEQFINSLVSITSLSAAAIQDIQQCYTEVFLPKHTVIVKEGEQSDKMYFILKGSARAFYFHNDKEITDWFTFENMFMCSLISFFAGKPSLQSIETLEPSHLLVFTRKDIDTLCEKHHDMERLNRLLLTSGLVSLQQGYVDQRFKTAQERYEILITTFPQIIKRVPLRYIASYLGVAQATLSRIRSSV